VIPGYDSREYRHRYDQCIQQEGQLAKLDDFLAVQPVGDGAAEKGQEKHG